MKKYKVSGQITVSAWTEVFANSEEEAIEIANEREVGSLCHNAIYPDIDEVWHFDNDGLPLKVRVEEAE